MADNDSISSSDINDLENIKLQAEHDSARTREEVRELKATVDCLIHSSISPDLFWQVQKTTDILASQVKCNVSKEEHDQIVEKLHNQLTQIQLRINENEQNYLKLETAAHDLTDWENLSSIIERLKSKNMNNQTKLEDSVASVRRLTQLQFEFNR